MERNNKNEISPGFYRIILDGKTYMIRSVVEHRDCVMLHLSADNRRYVLKLLRMGDDLSKEERKAWYNAYKARYELFRDNAYVPHVRIPRMIALVNSVNALRYGESTFGVMTEYVNGDRLEERLSFLHDLREKKKLMLSVLPDYIDALAYANSLGYYHMDITPGNLLVDGEGHGWLIDFIGAYVINRELDGSYHYCFSVDARKSMVKGMLTDGRRCEEMQVYMLCRLMMSVFSADEVDRLWESAYQHQKSAYPSPSPLSAFRTALSLL